MDTIQESLNQMILNFNQRMENFEKRQASQPGTPSSNCENLALEFAEFKKFILTSLRALQTQIEIIAKQADQQEIRRRRKMLLLHGVPEVPAEDLKKTVANIIINHFKLSSFTDVDISNCHRMGNLKNINKSRPILFKLCDETTRSKIWSSKVGLKGSGITLSEFLIRSRHEVFLVARKQFGITNCWTRDGIIFVIGPDGARIRLNSLDDIGRLSVDRAPRPDATIASTELAAATIKPKTKRTAATKKK